MQVKSTCIAEWDGDGPSGQDWCQIEEAELLDAYKVGPAQWRLGFDLQGRRCAVFGFSVSGLALGLIGVSVEMGS